MLKLMDLFCGFILIYTFINVIYTVMLMDVILKLVDLY